MNKLKTLILLPFAVFSINALASSDLIKLEIDNPENLKIQESKYQYNIMGKELINSASKEKFDIGFLLYKDEGGKYLMRDGVYRNQSGKVDFDLNISSEHLENSYDFIDIISNSSFLYLKSNSNLTNIFLHLFDEDVEMNEKFRVVKVNNDIYIEHFELKIDDNFVYNFTGQGKLVNNRLLIIGGKVNIERNQVNIEKTIDNIYLDSMVKDFFKVLYLKDKNNI